MRFNILWAAFAVLFLACACRERGQGHSWLGTQGSRVLFWALPVGAVVYLLLVGLTLDADTALVAAGCGLAAFVGMVAIPHGAGQNLRVPWSVNLGTVWPVDDTLWGIARPERLGYLLAAGTVRLWLLSLPLLPTHPAALWLPVGGVVMPLGYLLGTRMPLLGWRLTRATEWGEFLTGAGIGLALAITLLA